MTFPTDHQTGEGMARINIHKQCGAIITLNLGFTLGWVQVYLIYTLDPAKLSIGVLILYLGL